jgi:hypothetical protein
MLKEESLLVIVENNFAKKVTPVRWKKFIFKHKNNKPNIYLSNQNLLIHLYYRL